MNNPSPRLARRQTSWHLLALVAWSAWSAVAPGLVAQEKTAAAAAPALESPADETIVLSPFVVNAADDKDRYRATSTLAGTRVRTDLANVASAISVVTKQFLQDTGARNSQDLLVYTTNTEVGGPAGNFAAIGNVFVNGAAENLIRPNQSTRVRGLDSADNTRDFFQTEIPWDAYNVDRVDLQRGPNSILFGIGSPAGVINSSLNPAGFQTGGNLENRFGSFGSVRTSLDYNHVLLPRELSLRIAALDDDTKYRQEPAYNHDRRVFLALRWDPKLFNSDWGHTSLRANFEHGNVKANRPRILPPEDRITPYFDASAINKTSVDPYEAWAHFTVGSDSNATIGAGYVKNYWTEQTKGPGLQMVSNPVVIYSGPGASASTATYQAGTANLPYGRGATGTIDGSIEGFPFVSAVGIAGYSDYARYAGLPAAEKNFYKDKMITDPSIFDFYNHLIDGPNKQEWMGWNAFNAALEQTFFHNRLAVQAVYDHQSYHDGQERNIADPYISVDIDRILAVYPGAYATDATYLASASHPLASLVAANPNVGRAFIGSSSINGNNNATFHQRDTLRLTATSTFDLKDYVGSTFLARMLGRHTLTGLYTDDTHTAETRSWARYAIDNAYATDTGLIGQFPTLSSGLRAIDWVTYLSDDLSSAASASGLNLQAISALQSPSGSTTVRWFDSHWNATGVDPSAAWYNPARINHVSTESENPANYVGWRESSYRILNADQGDLDELYTDGAKVRDRVRSEAFTWQGFLADDLLVPMVGWRKDIQRTWTGNAPLDASTGAAKMDYDVSYLSRNAVENLSWGFVLRMPKSWRDRLPGGTELSLHYNRSSNNRIEQRYGFDGGALPNASGTTRDYGFTLSTLHDRLTFKATWYDTKIKNANISSVTTATSTLGSNTGWLTQIEAMGTASALRDLAGLQGKAPGSEWYWAWADADSGFAGGALYDPTSTEFLSHPSTIKEQAAVADWLATMQPQSFYDAYGYHIDVAKAKAGDLTAINDGTWDPAYGDVGNVQADGNGRVHGLWPTGTVDNESHGVELELAGQLTPNWNIAINASKTFAAQTALGAELSAFIESLHTRLEGPAGDLRLWWAGWQPIREDFNENIWAAYQFQLASNGRMVSEMSPWRFNAVTNLNLARGPLKGVNLGLGYRWEQGKILGYLLNDAKDNLDLDRPVWGRAQDAIDCWIGYSRAVSRQIDWRVQLNLRNVGDRVHLVPFSVQPDTGEPAGYRIAEGMTWTLTNTFTF